MPYRSALSILAFWAALAVSSGVSAQEDGFSWPISCVPGIDCTGSHFRIGYPDVAGTGLSFACSKPGYLGHQGTDIVVSSLEQGVKALAAGDGTVRWIENSMYDRCPDDTVLDCEEQRKSRLSSDPGSEATLGFNAGNYVVVEHIRDNVRYLTLYAHLRRDSVIVKPGDTVQRGQHLGDVASSGNSQIPHLHFGVFKAEGNMYRPVDPWKGACNTSSDGLWASSVPYRSSGMLQARPAQGAASGSEIYLQTIQRSLPKKRVY